MMMMSDQQFDARWQHNQEQRRAESAAVVGKWDQADALLLLESGWTQERIAGKVGKKQNTVSQWLCFGRFLAFIATGDNHRQDAPQASIPPTLTERAFRDVWSKTLKKSEDGTKYTEAERFEQASEILRAKFQLDPLGLDVARKRANLGERLARDYADGEWLKREQVLADMEDDGVDEKRLDSAIGLMRERNTHGCMVDEKCVKGQKLFRIRKLSAPPQIKSEKVIHFYEEAMPLLKEARSLTDRNITTVSMQSILHKLILLERLVKALHGEVGSD